jgi:hypothetical protein
MSVCGFCGYQADDENHLYAHYCSCHSCCLTCRFVFLNDDARRRHYLKSYVHNYCEICDRHFQSPRALKGHMETHEKRTVRCPRCNRGFPSKSAMTKHVRYDAPSLLAAFEVFLNGASAVAVRRLWTLFCDFCHSNSSSELK